MVNACLQPQKFEVVRPCSVLCHWPLTVQSAVLRAGRELRAKCSHSFTHDHMWVRLAKNSQHSRVSAYSPAWPQTHNFPALAFQRFADMHHNSWIVQHEWDLGVFNSKTVLEYSHGNQRGVGHEQQLLHTKLDGWGDRFLSLCVFSTPSESTYDLKMNGNHVSTDSLYHRYVSAYRYNACIDLSDQSVSVYETHKLCRFRSGSHRKPHVAGQASCPCRHEGWSIALWAELPEGSLTPIAPKNVASVNNACSWELNSRNNFR